MILELNGTKVTIVDKTLGYQGDNLVNTIQVTVDKDSTWNYKLDMYKGKSKCFDSVLMTREDNVCTVQLTNEILSYGGRYIFQLRGYTDTQTYHSDIFEQWVNASIEYQCDCKQAECECDCKLPTEFYQVEDNVTEINNHPPYPGDNGKWMIWDVNKHEYVESDIDVIGGGDYQTKANLTTSITAESTNEQYPSAKATYDYGQSIAQSAGKINAITVPLIFRELVPAGMAEWIRTTDANGKNLNLKRWELWIRFPYVEGLVTETQTFYINDGTTYSGTTKYYNDKSVPCYYYQLGDYTAQNFQEMFLHLNYDYRTKLGRRNAVTAMDKCTKVRINTFSSTVTIPENTEVTLFGIE